MTSYMRADRNILDLLDGSYYKKISENGFLHLMIFTDRIQITKSNNKQFWPVLLSLCEIPPKLRDSIENKLVFGVWIGEKKPNSNILFENLINQIEKINENGLTIRKNGFNLMYKLRIYGVLCDSPAKSLVINMNQFNGYYGCPYCLNPGLFKFKNKI